MIVPADVYKDARFVVVFISLAFIFFVICFIGLTLTRRYIRQALKQVSFLRSGTEAGAINYQKK